jgi:hypothetical protein
MAAVRTPVHVFRGSSPATRLPLRLGCALLCLFAAFPMDATVSAQPVSEYDVEAAYLYNFGKFVRWPDSASKGSTFDICILGDDPFGGTLEKLIANDHVHGRPIRKRMISRSAEAAGCAIVYISDSEAGNLHRILSRFAGSGVLLVSNLPDFAQQGGMVQFLLQGDRVRFKVNLNPANQSQLVLSSELLKVAVRVTGSPQGGVMR